LRFPSNGGGVGGARRGVSRGEGEFEWLLQSDVGGPRRAVMEEPLVEVDTMLKSDGLYTSISQPSAPDRLRVGPFIPSLLFPNEFTYQSCRSCRFGGARRHLLFVEVIN
jgi:hypothetical protein